MKLRHALLLASWVWAATVWAIAQPFHLPSPNRAFYQRGGGARFVVGTVGRSWQSGMFGCVRSDGHQFHEGLDIRCTQRDRHGEPTDPIFASADGVIAYVNHNPALSNYGIYIVIRHHLPGLEMFSLYAHLSKVRPDIRPGRSVKAGEVIGTMGRTANTRQRISKARAHVHFELDFRASERFSAWFRVHYPHERNDHGEWNGHNLLGIDPAQVFWDEEFQGKHFSVVKLLHAEPEICRVFVRDPHLSFARRNPALVEANPKVGNAEPAGYELALDYTGLPIRIIPLAASEVHGWGKVRLLSVNAQEARTHSCRDIVIERGGKWRLGRYGKLLLSLLTY